MSETENHPAYIDRYDAEVVNRMVVGDVYNVKTIRRAYKDYTEIRRDRTAKDRTKELVASPAFENVAIGRFKFTGCTESELL